MNVKEREREKKPLWKKNCKQDGEKEQETKQWTIWKKKKGKGKE